MSKQPNPISEEFKDELQKSDFVYSDEFLFKLIKDLTARVRELEKAREDGK